MSTDPIDRAVALDAALHFCEDAAASAPPDRAAPGGTGPLSGKLIGLKSNIRVAGQAWAAGIGPRDLPQFAVEAQCGGIVVTVGDGLVSRCIAGGDPCAVDRK